MRKAKLGTLEVNAIGLGCMGMSVAYGAADADEAERTLHRALDLGVDLLDTANAYGFGANEELIGRALKSRRDEFALSTKFGFVRTDKGMGVDGHPDQIAGRCEESLQHLGMETIDIYFMHRLDPNVPIEETVGGMARLVEQGKVRHLGLCEVSSKTLRRAHAVHPIAAVQSEYSLWCRDPEAHVLPTCRELGVGFMPFSPLGRAMLTGSVRDEVATSEAGDLRASMPRFHGEALEANLALVQRFGAIAEEKGVTRGQLALAWLLSQGDDIAPIPGTKRVKYLEENVAAGEIVLSDEEREQMEAIFDPAEITGERYAPAMMQTLDRD
jgi:aryl-alcohol dehydrogenase-like predicted oxidoreductase